MYIDFLPSYFELWHLPVVLLAGLIGEGYAVVLGGGGILIQFVLLSLGLPLPAVIATDIAGCMGSSLGVLTALPRNTWNHKKLLVYLGVPFLIGGIIGTLFLTKISTVILSYLIIVALVGLLAHMVLGQRYTSKPLHELQVTPKQYPLLASIMVTLGVYGNVSGVGVGTFQKIAFTSLLQMRVVDGIGMINVLWIPLTIFSIIVTAMVGLVIWPYVFALWVGTFIGSHFVARHVQKIPDEYLKRFLFVIAVIYLIYLVISVVK